MFWRLRKSVKESRSQVSRWLDRLFVRWSGRHPRLARLYYAFWNNAFSRETFAVLRGRLAYEKADSKSSSSLLRRNVHRIEKGLLMRPRRPLFALDYIGETVEEYLRVGATCKDRLSLELQWANSTLRKYFDAVDCSHEVVQDAYGRFSDCDIDVPDNGYSPYQRPELEVPHVSYQSFYDLTRHRRSVRWFEQRPVERAKIDAAISAGLQSPSACNRQPFKVLVVDDPELVKQIAKIPMGTVGYADNIPVMLVFLGDQGNYFSERDRHLIYIDASLAAMGTIYALETMGLSSCCINWPDIPQREQQLAELLNLPPEVRATMFLAVGYPDPEGLVAYSAKKTLDEVRFYNSLSSQ